MNSDSSCSLKKNIYALHPHVAQQVLQIFCLIVALFFFSNSSAAYDYNFNENTTLADLENLCKVDLLNNCQFTSNCDTNASEIYALPDSESWGIGALSKDDTYVSSAPIDKMEMIRARVEPNNPNILNLSRNITAHISCERCIKQVSLIYDYLLNVKGPKMEGWNYVSDPRSDHYSYANETLNYVNDTNRTGVGDCDDFAILMSSLVEAIGGTTRIVLSRSNDGVGHAYTEVYLGKLCTQDDSNILDIMDWLKTTYNTIYIYLDIDNNTHYVWLNLDWGEDEMGYSHPGLHYFVGKRYIIPIGKDENNSQIEPQPLSFNYSPKNPKLHEDVIFVGSEKGQWSSDREGLLCNDITDSCRHRFDISGIHIIKLSTDHNLKSVSDSITISQ